MKYKKKFKKEFTGFICLRCKENKTAVPYKYAWCEECLSGKD